MLKPGLYRTFREGWTPIWPNTSGNIVGWVGKNEMIVLLYEHRSRWFVIANQRTGWIYTNELESAECVSKMKPEAINLLIGSHV